MSYLEDWISIRDAFAMLRLGLQLDDSAAKDICLAELVSGKLQARAFGNGVRANGPNIVAPLQKDGSLSPSVWAQIVRGGLIEADWGTGNFKLYGAYGGYSGYLSTVRFERQGIEAILGRETIARINTPPNDAANLPAEPGYAASGRGRKPANWWPDFAEELAVHIYQNGLPAGSGAEGQGDLIVAIFSALQERGKTEPSKETIRPVINAVLKRLRETGN